MAKMPSYRLHKASGQGVTTIRGKTYYFGPFGDKNSKQKFRSLLAEYLLSNQSPTFRVNPADLTLAEVFLLYLAYAKNYYGNDSTEYKNIKMAVRPISESLPRALAAEFGPLHFKLLRQWWIDRGVSRQYCNAQMKRVLRAIKWLVSEEILSASIHHALKCVDPLKKGRTKAPEAPPIRPVEDSIVDQTIPHMSKIVADMVRFQRLTGCRYTVPITHFGKSQCNHGIYSFG